MIELIGGSGVYLYKSQLALCKTNCKSRSSLACQLLRVFFTDDQLENGKLSGRGSGDFAILDPHITSVIKAYCSSTSFKTEIKVGHKKGITHAMTLSIKRLRRKGKCSAGSKDLEEPSVPNAVPNPVETENLNQDPSDQDSDLQNSDQDSEAGESSESSSFTL